jgi:phosphoribosylaminoimidazolecarboxamide formyltransferase/IMP cyclohydrolase
MNRTIKTALISVFHKDGLAPIVNKLNDLGVEILSTGGTLKFIQELGVNAKAVDELTGFPEILDGRVKTLHPTIFGGILARRDNSTDLSQLDSHKIPTIDLVIVDLYPFEDTVKQTSDVSTIIEKIDIGGISLIRATAKNYHDTLIVSAREQYAEVLDLLNSQSGESTLDQRKRFAAKAFQVSSHYDTQIFNYFNTETDLPGFKKSFNNIKELRYGENPHQTGFFYGNLEEVFDTLHGRDLSYNNLVDVEASIHVVAEFSQPTFAIIKHTNTCGLASSDTIKVAYEKALACDPTSAFGGVLAANKKIDKATAEEMNKLFFEVVTAPDFEDNALEVLKQKKNRIILKLKQDLHPKKMFKSMLNGVLEQDVDQVSEISSDFKIVTEREASLSQLNDLEFAVKAVKHLKSNGIALVKNQQLIGMGCGQTSRVDALESAIKKSKNFGFDLAGAVMASEAFFPFPDCVAIGADAGIEAISQPGGSIKDQDSIDEANKRGIAMVFTGIRHFKH